MKTTLLTLLSIIMLPLTSTSQNDGFIYGKVTTIDNDTYEGPIRWGKEEVYWTDMFNAAKDENKNVEYLSRDERDYLDDRRRSRYSNGWNVVNISWDGDDNYTHQYGCQFGEIKKLEVMRRNDVMVTLQNGQKILVNGSGYNDIGSDVKIIDSDLGEVALDWDRVETVEFMAAPGNLSDSFGEALYGTVYSEQGEFTGFVQWDHDERVSTDKLDGDSDDGRLSINFGKIKSIENDYNSSDVVLNSGRKLNLDGTNDVDNDNKGIIVTVEGLGRVDIPWREFDKVEFTTAPKSVKKYSEFKNSRKLTGTVTVSNGDKHSGEIIYDLDETFDYEILDGEIDRTEYEIIFRNIKSIEPRNDDSSSITLKSGDKLTLYDSQDVDDKNTGIVILTNGNPVYVPWEQVEKVTFD